VFSNISVQRWEQFFDTIYRIMQCEEGSETERMKEIWDKAEHAGCYIEMTDLVYGLEVVRNADDSEEEIDGSSTNLD